jgi:hypothetical protein
MLEAIFLINAMVEANAHWGESGATQCFILDFDVVLKPIGKYN